MTNLKLVTYNMRCPYDTYDGVNAFIHRLPVLALIAALVIF